MRPSAEGVKSCLVPPSYYKFGDSPFKDIRRDRMRIEKRRKEKQEEGKEKINNCRVCSVTE